LPCAQLTLGIDPRRTDYGVGGRLVEGFALQRGAQIEWASGNKSTVVLKPRTIYVREGHPL
jgi:hypothetical protein